MTDEIQQAPPGWSLSGVLANAPSGAAQAPAPAGNVTDPAMRAATQQVAQPHSTLPAPMPDKPQRIHSASGLMGFLSMEITNAVAAHKEKKINEAMANYMTIYNAQQRAEDMVNKSGVDDPQKRQEMMKQFVSNDPSVKDTFYGPKGEKNVKAMKDLLKVDFTDPESMNTVQHQALKRVTKIIGAQEAMKLVAGLKQKFQAQQGQGQQQQPTPEQQQKSYEGTVGKAVGQTVPQPVDVKAATGLATAQADVVKAQSDMVKAQADARSKYDFKPTAEGNLLALDKTTGKATPLTDEKGNPLTAQTKVAAGEGKVAFVEGVPYGITHAGPDGKPRIITPDMSDWTALDAKTFAAATAAAAQGEANKAKLATKRQSYFGSLPQAVMAKVDDPQKGIKAGELAFVSRDEAASNPAKYAPVGSGDKALGTQARFGEIQATVDMTNRAIDNLPDTAFDAKARAQIAYVLRAPDPASALDAFFKSDAATTLSDPQIDYVTSLASMAESAQAMSSLQGIGARGSDTLRAAIVAMLPSGSTPSRKYAESQMKKFQIELDQLRKGVPTLGGLSGGAPAGTISFTDAGVTYDIPKDKVAAFKRAHPNAATAR